MANLLRTIAVALVAFLGACATATAQPAAASEWSGVARVVTFGDLHGDYAKFIDMARDAGLINAAGNWSGGQTHFVQLGDVVDRGPDSRKILDHLMRLEPEARKAGGYLHALIGNHEGMNVEGDLRYVSTGEYVSYTDRNTARRRMVPRPVARSGSCGRTGGLVSLRTELVVGLSCAARSLRTALCGGEVVGRIRASGKHEPVAVRA